MDPNLLFGKPEGKKRKTFGFARGFGLFDIYP